MIIIIEYKFSILISHSVTHLVFKGSGQGQLNRPWDVTFDSEGFLYVADTFNHRIQKFTPEGRVVNMFGTTDYQLKYPAGITVDNNDLLYVTEGSKSQISIFTTSGQFIHCFGETGDKEGQFKQPRELIFDKCEYLYVCDRKNSRVVVY